MQSLKRQLLIIVLFVITLPAWAAVELPLSGCNRGFSIHVLTHEQRQTYGNEAAPDGYEWQIITAKFDNWIAADLVLQVDYDEALLVGSLNRQLYLTVNNQHVVRAKVLESAPSADSFVLSNMGDSQLVEVGYLTPIDAESLVLSYFHELFSPINLVLRGDHNPPTQPPANAQVKDNDVMALALVAHSLQREYQGQTARNGWQWLIAEVQGASRWFTELPRRAYRADAALDDNMRQPRVMEYIGADFMWQAVVDGHHGFAPNMELSTLPVVPAWLPEQWVSGTLVYEVPENFAQLELVAYFGDFLAKGIQSIPRDGLRFAVADSATEVIEQPTLLTLSDTPTPVTVHSFATVSTFADSLIASGAQRLAVLQLTMANTSAEGGMMRLLSRFELETATGEILRPQQIYQRGQRLSEPFYLPPNDKRHVQLLYALPQDVHEFTLRYRGVSENHRVALSLGD